MRKKTRQNIIVTVTNRLDGLFEIHPADFFSRFRQESSNDLIHDYISLVLSKEAAKEAKEYYDPTAK